MALWLVIGKAPGEGVEVCRPPHHDSRLPWWLRWQRNRLPKTLVRFLRWEDSLEKEPLGFLVHPGFLAWRIPWAEEPGRLQSIGSQRVGHDFSD